MKIFLANNWQHYANWLNGEIVDNIADADLVLFEGGVDVDPRLYGDRIGRHTDKPEVERDEREMKLFRKAVELNKKILGICRGLN